MFGMGAILKSLPINPDAEGIGMEVFDSETEEQLWFEYLAVSPSYELARRYRSGELTDWERARRPADFDRVLSVYDNLGDVQSISFRKWWRLRGSKHLMAENERSMVEILGTLVRESDSDAEIDDALMTYKKGAWPKQGMPDAMIVAIPKDLHPSAARHQLKALMNWTEPMHRKKIVNEPTYGFAGKRIHVEVLLRNLYVLYYRANLPDADLWRIGAHTQISTMHSPYIDPVDEKPTKQDQDRRDTLGILTSRASRNALMISENAARGIFPSHRKVDGLDNFDYSELRDLMILRDNRRIDAACAKHGITRDQYKGRQLEKLVKLMPRAQPNMP